MTDSGGGGEPDADASVGHEATAVATDDAADAAVRGELTPDEAFALLGNDTRFSILQALWDAPDHEASFSELRSAVGLSDSGQFNYHLGKLVGPFVSRTDDGYRLRIAGERVVGAVFSGVYTRDETIDPVEVDGSCYTCGGPLAVSYVDELATVDCTDCGERTAWFPVAVGLLDGYDREEVPTVVDTWLRVVLRQITAGVCPTCNGRLDAELTSSDGAHVVGVVSVIATCQRCHDRASAVLGGFLLEHPAVVAFLHDHGVDVRDRPFWSFDWIVDPDASELQNTDPPTARLAIPAPDGSETLTLTVDADLTVTTARRD